MRPEERTKIPYSVIVSEEVGFKGIICLHLGEISSGIQKANSTFVEETQWKFSKLPNFSALIVHVDSDPCFITQTQRVQIGQARLILLATTSLLEFFGIT